MRTATTMRTVKRMTTVTIVTTATTRVTVTIAETKGGRVPTATIAAPEITVASLRTVTTGTTVKKRK